VEALCGYYAGYHGEMFVLLTNISSPQDDVIGQLTRIRGAGFLSDPNDLAQILLIVLPLAFIAWRRGRMVTNFFVVLLPAALLLWTTYLTHSRGGLVALAAVALMAARKRLGTTTSAALAALFILGMISLDFTGGRGMSAADGADRLEAWANGLEMFKSAPLFGIGFNGFTDLYEITAHNSFVLCLAELGLLGSTLWMALATARSSVANTLAAACPAMISRAMFGPVKAAAGCPGSTSLMTWVIRSNDPSSSPLARLTTGIHGRTHGRASSRTARNPALGTPTTSRSASVTAASRSAVARNRGGRTKPGRYPGLVWSASI